MNVIEISANNSTQIREFHDCLEIIYFNDSNFIPYIISDVEAVFNPSKNKRFSTGNAKRWLLKNPENQCIGRIAAFHYTIKNRRWGGWGFFDCLEGETAGATLLIETAERWLKSQGCERIQAPVNFGDRDSFWGLLIEGNQAPTYMENYHSNWYRAHIESLGYEREIEQTTYEISSTDFNYTRFNAIAQRVMQNSEYRFEFLRFSQLEKYAKDFVEIYNQAWSFHEDFTPLTEAELIKRFKQMRWALYEEFAVFAYCKERPIAFYVNILELNEVFQYFNGQLGWLNQLRFLMSRSKISRAKGIIFGVVPDFQQLGIETGLIMKFHEGLKKHPQISNVELAWIGDFNPKMLSMLKSLGAKLSKTHHTYFKIFS